MILVSEKAAGKRALYPPGPPGHLLLGNLFDIPKTELWLKAKGVVGDIWYEHFN